MHRIIHIPTGERVYYCNTDKVALTEIMLDLNMVFVKIDYQGETFITCCNKLFLVDCVKDALQVIPKYEFELIEIPDV